MTKTSQMVSSRSPVDTLQTILADDLAKVEALLASRAVSPIEMIPDMTNHIIGAGGKRLRPIVTLAAAHVAGGVTEGSYALAAAVEYIHTATLLHDDVIDDSDLRRGRASAKHIWGNSGSILVGDFLFARAFTLMVETGNIDILDILSNASTVITEGEVRQLSAQGRLDLPTEEYLAIIEAKTAALFEAAARAGALSGGSEAASAALAAYGKNLGMAFQIVDDVLDYGGTTSVIGKSVGDDFREGKVTMPVVIARRRGSDEDKIFWDRALQPDKQNDSDLTHAIHLIRATGAAEATVAEAEAYAGLAKQALNGLPKSKYTEALADLADFCVSRLH
ncbi:MAG: polyprenyl synthetase family protein [Pseudomonadota bacterium]